MELNEIQLTDRQKRELEYHVNHAKQHADLLNKPFSFDVITSSRRRWWNAYWDMYTFFLNQNLKDKKVMVVGCGFGDDALRLSKMGADVYAFDLSDPSLEIAQSLAERENLNVQYQQMTAEKLKYPDNFFDCVLARDILHHVDIPTTMQEIVRVSSNKALFVVNEVYSHSFTDKIRHSNLVEKYMYPLMQKFVYKGEKPYITVDERKLTQIDISQITKPMETILIEKYFNFLVNRIFPDSYELLNKIDRFMLIITKPISYLLGGRVFIAGRLKK